MPLFGSSKSPSSFTGVDYDSLANRLPKALDDEIGVPTPTYSSLSDFLNRSVLCKGGYSTVWSCVCKRTLTPLVVKGYSKAKMKAVHHEQVRNEVAAMELLSKHRFSGAVRLLGHFEDAACVYLVQEHCQRGSLYDLLVRTQERSSSAGAAGRGGLAEEWVAAEVLVPLLLTLEHCHAHGLLHRDIKPENIFFTSDSRVKLGDWGLAAFCPASPRDPPLRGVVGTLDYMSPEVAAAANGPPSCRRGSNGGGRRVVAGAAASVAAAQGGGGGAAAGAAASAAAAQGGGGGAAAAAAQGDGGGARVPAEATGLAALPAAAACSGGSGRTLYTDKVDVWAMGVLAHELLAGRPPFVRNSERETAINIQFGEPTALPAGVSPQCRDFIAKALCKCPENRPTAAQLLSHPWLAAQYHKALPREAPRVASLPDMKRALSTPPAPPKPQQATTPRRQPPRARTGPRNMHLRSSDDTSQSSASYSGRASDPAPMSSPRGGRGFAAGSGSGSDARGGDAGGSRAALLWDQFRALSRQLSGKSSKSPRSKPLREHSPNAQQGSGVSAPGGSTSPLQQRSRLFRSPSKKESAERAVAATPAHAGQQASALTGHGLTTPFSAMPMSSRARGTATRSRFGDRGRAATLSSTATPLQQQFDAVA